MSADTPTPPLPLGDVTALLRGRADALRWDVAYQTKIGHEVTAHRLAHEEQQYLAAATTLEGLEAVMRTMPTAPDFVSDDYTVKGEFGVPQYVVRCEQFVARLRAVVGTGTPEEESDA